MLLKLPFVEYDFFEELGIRGHLGDGIQKRDVDLQLLEDFQEFSKFGLKLGLGKALGEGTRGP